MRPGEEGSRLNFECHPGECLSPTGGIGCPVGQCNRSPIIPDTACICIEQARKAAIAETRRLLTDALWPTNVRTHDEWRRLSLQIIFNLRGM